MKTNNPSSIATREFGHFLVKFEVDDRYYVCTRIKILTEGRVRMGEYYNVGGDGDGEETGEFNCTSNSVIFFCMSNQSPVYTTSAISASSSVLPQTTL
jgi:hypothetical protein